MGAKLNGQVGMLESARVHAERPVAPGGDPYGTHRTVSPPLALPQPAWRLDNDFSRIFEGEALLSVQTLNIDAASFAQMEDEAGPLAASSGTTLEASVAHIVLRT